MDRKPQHHAEPRRMSPLATASTVKIASPPKAVKRVTRPSTAVVHTTHAGGKVSAASSPKADNTYAVKARREWEQAMMARKCHEFRSSKPFPEAVRRKRAGDVSPSDTSAENIRPAVRPPDVTVAALKGVSSTASSNVVSPAAYAARRPIASPTNAAVRRVTNHRLNKSELEPTQSVTILRIREPERVPATDLDIPEVNTTAPTVSHAASEAPPLMPIQRSNPSPIKRPSFGSSVAGATSSSSSPAAPSKAIGTGGGPSPSHANLSTGHSPPKPVLSHHAAASQNVNNRTPSFMSLPPGYTVKAVPPVPLANSGSGATATQPRTIAFVFPVLQAAVQQGIISAHQCHQLTSLFATKPLPPAEPELRTISSLGAPQPAWPPIPQQPMQPKSRPTEMAPPASQPARYSSPGPPARTPLQSPPPPARHPPARNAKEAASMLDERLGRRRSPDSSVDAKELFNAVCSALQQQPGRKDAAPGGLSTKLNGHRHSTDHWGLPCSPTSSYGSVSESSSVVSDSVVLLAAPESPKPARAVLYRTFSGDTVVIPPLNFRLLRK